MDGEEVILFFQLLTPFAGGVFLVTGLIGLGIYRKTHRISNGVKACLCVMVLVVVGWTGLLLQMRHENISYLEENESRIDTGTVIYWDDYADRFHYEGEEYVAMLYRQKYPNWFELEERAWYFGEQWEQDHAVFILRDRQSLAKWLAAYDDRCEVFSTESGCGETILLSDKHNYHCKKKAIDRVLAYYSDLNNYDFYVDGKKVKAPGPEAINALNQLMTQTGQRLDRHGKRYGLSIISKDQLYAGTIVIEEIDGTYYAIGYEFDKASDEMVDIAWKIPQEAAEELTDHLGEDPFSDD